MDKKQISREELYELVWSKPMVQVASLLKVKDHVLRAICRSNTIPLPQPGHWSKLRYGKSVERMDLPQHDYAGPIEFFIPGTGESQGPVFKDDHQKRIYELKHDHTLNFKVPVKLRVIHPLVKRTRVVLEQWEHSHNFSRHRSYDGDEDILPIHTEAKLRPRALRLINTLIGVVEKMGHQLIFEYGRCHVQMFGQNVEIHLRQKFNRVRTKDNNGYGMETWVKTEKLEFMKGPSYDQKRWMDKKTIPLEESLPEIVAWIEKTCRYWCKLRQEQQKERHIKELEKLREEERTRVLAEDRQQFDQLVNDAMDWKKANLLRDYVNALESTLNSDTGSGITRAYIQWAREKIKSLDPLSR
ncbi:hypothetical protein [Flagellimonas aequoris]|uniref:Uncharacterized protein n=1 Tax=Flagellimonas aequoris TaxID=2306997 RepID=A0A418N8U1_9FLAO|nr:hypothetical protein [Allomuricauda aequoris]RIV71571.1 hypothetical protein D2U88_07335 [Allomuricauda aequoris]TXK03135.1 hypothetical protein FQ019_07280 [Allomuricauda aequoris]